MRYSKTLAVDFRQLDCYADCNNILVKICLIRNVPGVRLLSKVVPLKSPYEDLITMKSALHAVVASLVLVAPVLASAQQPDAPIQRAQVRAELMSLERAGYTPGYPASLPAAEERLANSQTPETQAGGYGPSLSGSSQAGRAATSSTAQSVYFGL
jgi:hypothetical protein